jgi:hypothetical protein
LITSATGKGARFQKVIGVKRYKYQALVTMYPEASGAGAQLDRSPRRMVLRCPNGKSPDRQVFTVLISCDDTDPFDAGSSNVLATLRLVGDDDADCLSSGSHFSLWLGRDVGEGTITRRLFI